MGLSMNWDRSTYYFNMWWFFNGHCLHLWMPLWMSIERAYGEKMNLKLVFEYLCEDCWPWLHFQPFIFNNRIDYAWKWGAFFCWNYMCTSNYLLLMSWILRWLFFTPKYCWVIKSLNCMNITSLCFKMHVCPFHWVFQFLCQANDLEVTFLH